MMNIKYIARNGHSANGAIIGMVLGDSYLHRSSLTANTNMQTEHGDKYLDYLEFKKNYLNAYLSGVIRPTIHKNLEWT